jgi:hypothetical protein
VIANLFLINGSDKFDVENLSNLRDNDQLDCMEEKLVKRKLKYFLQKIYPKITH